jgi:hypothetical protein
MPKRKTQKNKNKRVGKKQRRRTAVRQHGGKIFTLYIKNSNNSETIFNAHDKIGIKNIIDKQIDESKRNDYVFTQRSSTEYAVTSINLFNIDMDAQGTTISNWDHLMNSKIYPGTTYAENFMTDGLLPYVVFMKEYFP